MGRTGIGAAVLLGTMLLSSAALADRGRSRAGIPGRAEVAAANTALKTPRFSAPAWIDSGKEGVFRLVAADLSGDGDADVAVLDPGAASLAVRFGDGRGQFGRRTTYRTGRDPTGLVASDLNGDHRLDLATAGDSVTVFLNRGAGRFRRTGVYGAGRGAYAVAAGDVNEDGIVDLLTAHATRKPLTVLLGRRAGGFRIARHYRGDRAYDIAVADLNGDGKLDVVLSDDNHDAVSVRLGGGDGRFGTAARYKSELGSYGVTVADLNHDRRLDIAAASSRGESVSVFLGAGDGSFGPSTPYPMLGGGGYVDTALVADYDRDGHLDIATPGASHVRRGRGDGTFEDGQRAFEGPAFTQAGAVADFNGDGWPDLAFSQACDEIEDYCESASIAVRLNWTGRHSPPCVVPDWIRETSSCAHADARRMPRRTRPSPRLTQGPERHRDPPATQARGRAREPQSRRPRRRPRLTPLRSCEGVTTAADGRR